MKNGGTQRNKDGKAVRPSGHIAPRTARGCRSIRALPDIRAGWRFAEPSPTVERETRGREDFGWSLRLCSLPLQFSLAMKTTGDKESLYFNPMKNILLQFERLRRHYEQVVRTYDEVSLLDLTHSLRNWTELAGTLQELAPVFSDAMAFRTSSPTKRASRSIKGYRYVLAYMPGGALTYANINNIFSSPELGEMGFMENGGVKASSSPTVKEPYLISITLKATHETLELSRLCLVVGDANENMRRLLTGQDIQRRKFKQWLESECVKLSYINADNKLEFFTISLKTLIRRVSNNLTGASHPLINSENFDQENRFDAPIKYLFEYKVGGLPLPYFIILKAAQDIIGIFPKYIPIDKTKTPPD